MRKCGSFFLKVENMFSLLFCLTFTVQNDVNHDVIYTFFYILVIVCRLMVGRTSDKQVTEHKQVRGN